MVSLLLLFACSDPQPEEQVSTPAELSSSALLARLSLDLRGVRPSDDELERAASDPEQIDNLTDEFLNDERFGGRVRDLFSEIYLTRTETWPLSAGSFGLDDEAAFNSSLGEEPLRILSTMADEDLPYTELVLADWTMANETLASFLPTDYPEGDSGWQKVHYTDGRPAAGVLATSGLWWRYTSTDSNANRKRANAVSRILLCDDYLDRAIDFDRNLDLLDEEAVKSAIETNPACVNCHSSLDPLASYFYGFWWYNTNSALELSRYHPERERLWQDTTGIAPSYFGTPSSSLGDLSWQIAADPRFPNCAVAQVRKLLLRRDAAVADTTAFNDVRTAFLENGLTLRALFAAAVADPGYRAGRAGDEGEDLQGSTPAKMVTADQLASQVEDLTGFRWTQYGYDMLGTDSVGVRTLAGGVDGATVTAVASAPNATLILVQERLAEGAARYAVQTEGEQSLANRRLFSEVDFTETPESGESAIIDQIVVLQRRVLSRTVEADGPEVEADLALWEELYGVTNSPTEAWTGLLSAMMRDPDFLIY